MTWSFLNSELFPIRSIVPEIGLKTSPIAKWPTKQQKELLLNNMKNFIANIEKMATSWKRSWQCFAVERIENKSTDAS